MSIFGTLFYRATPDELVFTNIYIYVNNKMKILKCNPLYWLWILLFVF